MVILNVFAFRSPYPPHVYAADDPIGPDNDKHIRRMAKKANKVVVGWGVHGTLIGRGESVADAFANTKSGLGAWARQRPATPSIRFTWPLPPNW